jgi:hypothetical protein
MCVCCYIPGNSSLLPMDVIFGKSMLYCRSMMISEGSVFEIVDNGRLVDEEINSVLCVCVCLKLFECSTTITYVSMVLTLLLLYGTHDFINNT